MRTKHKVFAFAIFLAITGISYFTKSSISDLVVQNLVTFFSIVFGFYVTAIAILTTSTYIKTLHEIISEKEQKRGTHILRSYLKTSGYLLIISIISIIAFSIFATKNTGGMLNISLPLFWGIDCGLILSSCLFGISAVNVYFMILIFNLIIDNLVEVAKNKG